MEQSYRYEEAILHALREQQAGMTTEQLYEFFEHRYPDLCPAKPRCAHLGVTYGQAEWKHRMRSVQQTLKKLGKIELRGGFWKRC